MKVSITEDCVACEQCVDVCPDVFQMGDEIAEVIVDEISEEYMDEVEEAADVCPTDAIVIE